MKETEPENSVRLILAQLVEHQSRVVATSDLGDLLTFSVSRFIKMKVRDWPQYVCVCVPSDGHFALMCSSPLAPPPCVHPS